MAVFGIGVFDTVQWGVKGGSRVHSWPVCVCDTIKNMSTERIGQCFLDFFGRNIINKQELRTLRRRDENGLLWTKTTISRFSGPCWTDCVCVIVGRRNNKATNRSEAEDDKMWDKIPGVLNMKRQESRALHPKQTLCLCAATEPDRPKTPQHLHSQGYVILNSVDSRTVEIR